MRNGRFKRLVRAFEECEIDDGMKREVLDMLEELYEKKEFGLVWNKERTVEDVVKDCENKVPILEKVHEKSIAKEGNTQNNIFIEGDNYHSLQVLNQTHRGEIDVIYIDPPYNTKNKEFIYNDKRVDAEDDYRHSKWLSFMEKRLQLAKDLLSESGAIFISIDDNEQANLRLLCNEIFGEENFVGMLIWRKKEGGGQASTHFVVEHEYVLVYMKSEKFEWIDEEVPVDESLFNKEDELGKFTVVKLSKWGNTARREDRPKMYFPIKGPNGKNVYPVAPDGADGRWRVGRKRMESLVDNNLIFWREKDGDFIPYEKIYFDSEDVKKIKERSILYEVANTGDGSNELTEIFGRKDVFENPKPSGLIKFFLQYGVDKNAIVLDFFAGSGTTGHAVLALNKEDGGDRRFILCTNNENNNGNGSGGIAESVCYPRIQKVIEGYKKNGDGEEVAGLGGGLEYFKTDFVDVNTRAMTDVDKLKVSKKVGYILGMRHGCFEEAHLNDFYHILEREDFGVFIYFEEDLREFRNFQEHIRGKNGVLYSYAGNTKKGFGIEEDDKDYTGITLEKIPEQFIAVYRNCIS